MKIIGKDIKPAVANFGDNEDEAITNAVRQPFTALDYAMRNGHHPRLWQAVKGSVYQNEYRRNFGHHGLDETLGKAPFNAAGAVGRIQHRVNRLRAKGWKQKDFAGALKGELTGDRMAERRIGKEVQQRGKPTAESIVQEMLDS